MMLCVRRCHASLRLRKCRPIYLLLVVLLFCATSIRPQELSSSSDTDGSQDSTPTTQTNQPSTTSTSSNDSPVVSKTPIQSSRPSGVISPSGTENTNQFGSTSDDQPNLDGTQTTATNLPPGTTSNPVRPKSSSPSSQPISSRAHNRYHPQTGLRGKRWSLVVGGIGLFTAMIIYFRRLERSIAQDKKEFREKQARRYNLTEHDAHTHYIPGNQPQPYEV
ncbi:hypothetical protein PSTT_15497 [Puccinia striiformis]|uniref:Uncharacterized protein n=1 Tax=Puccinia striiformis TaxID=27350 RepID=A0A2S4UHS7_9BASI|nr:hypothetical protein PSTT_15497 [Puccinia striiformis]